MTSLKQLQLGLLPTFDEGLVIPAKDAELKYFPQAFPAEEADRLLHYCLQELPWQQDQLKIAGRTIPVPRLQNWFGDDKALYTYSGISLEPQPWTEPLRAIRDKVEYLCGSHFNAVLANLYRDGNDGVAWHSDDEKELGMHPVIASLSLGTPRVFEMRHQQDRQQKTIRIILGHGSLLLMAGTTQSNWLHRVPKSPNVLTPRVNLTLRKIILRDSD